MERFNFFVFGCLWAGLFDRDQSGQIELSEFQALWNYITQWRTVFEQFDRDRSGSIDANELNTGLKFCFACNLLWTSNENFEVPIFFH